jgi:tripartite-type tricarboxylate transporter receptor subunit TctC
MDAMMNVFLLRRFFSERWQDRWQSVLKLSGIVLLLAGSFAHGRAAAAESYPTRSIRIVVPTSPGGTTDLLGRLLANHIAAATGVQVVVENRGGAGGNIGMDLVAKAAPDGYTLGFANTGIVINRYTYKNMPFDPLKDLVPIGPIGEAPQLLIVNAELPAQSLHDFIALAKTRPGGFNYGSAGLGSTMHLAADQFARLAGVKLVHIPYRGAAPAITDLVTGNLQMISVSLGPVAGFVQSGKLRVLVAASDKRIRFLPQVPSSAESGLPGYEMATWFGLFAPRGTSSDVAERLNGLIREMLASAEIQKHLADNSVEELRMTPAEFARFLTADSTKWERVVRDSGLQAQ